MKSVEDGKAERRRNLAQEEAQHIRCADGDFRCPRCGWVLHRNDDNGDGFITCACGASVEIPE